jgi:hypothetical protein
MKVAKQAGSAELRPHIPEMVKCLLEALSSMEDSRLNYIEQHTQAIGMSADKLEHARLHAAKAWASFPSPTPTATRPLFRIPLSPCPCAFTPALPPRSHSPFALAPSRPISRFFQILSIALTRFLSRSPETTMAATPPTTHPHTHTPTHQCADTPTRRRADTPRMWAQCRADTASGNTREHTKLPTSRRRPWERPWMC